MKWIELREWLSLAPADLPCWASGALLVLTFFSGGGVLTASLAAGSIVLAVVGAVIGVRRNPQLGENYNRIKRWSYPVLPFLVIAGVGYQYARNSAPAEDPVDPSAKPAVITSGPHKFSISFPPPYNNPEEQTLTHGPNTQTIWTVTRKNGVLGISVVVYPDQIFKTNTPEGLLGEVHFAAVQHLEGRIEKQENLLIDGHPALRSIVDHHDRKGQKGYSRFELICVPPRVYTLRTSHSNRDALDGALLKSFAESFRLRP
jgi:hypothetical protein